MPMMLKFAARSPNEHKLYSEGMSFRLVRSPDAPKITIAHGSPARGVGWQGFIGNVYSIGRDSTWPPNLLRMAESTFSANVCSFRERKRVKREALSTSAGVA